MSERNQVDRRQTWVWCTERSWREYACSARRRNRWQIYRRNPATHARTHRRTSLTHTVRQTDGILWWHMSVYRVRIIFCFCTSYKNAERGVGHAKQSKITFHWRQSVPSRTFCREPGRSEMPGGDNHDTNDCSDLLQPASVLLYFSHDDYGHHAANIYTYTVCHILWLWYSGVFCLSVWLCACLLVSVATTGTCASDEKVVFQVVLVFHHHLTLVIPRLKPSFSANPSHRSLPFVLQDWLHGFRGLFAVCCVSADVGICVCAWTTVSSVAYTQPCCSSSFTVCLCVTVKCIWGANKQTSNW